MPPPVGLRRTAAVGDQSSLTRVTSHSSLTRERSQSAVASASTIHDGMLVISTSVHLNASTKRSLRFFSVSKSHEWFCRLVTGYNRQSRSLECITVLTCFAMQLELGCGLTLLPPLAMAALPFTQTNRRSPHSPSRTIPHQRPLVQTHPRTVPLQRRPRPTPPQRTMAHQRLATTTTIRFLMSRPQRLLRSAGVPPIV